MTVSGMLTESVAIGRCGLRSNSTRSGLGLGRDSRGSRSGTRSRPNTPVALTMRICALIRASVSACVGERAGARSPARLPHAVVTLYAHGQAVRLSHHDRETAAVGHALRRAGLVESRLPTRLEQGDSLDRRRTIGFDDYVEHECPALRWQGACMFTGGECRRVPCRVPSGRPDYCTAGATGLMRYGPST